MFLSEQEMRGAVPTRQAGWTDEYMCMWMGSFVETEISRKITKAIAIFCREELGNMNFESDKEAVDYILSFADMD